MAGLESFTVFDHLQRAGVPLHAQVRLGDGLAAAAWRRDETVLTSYVEPGHHTLSLYVEGGDGIRRRRGDRVTDHGGSGTLCLMPAGLTTDWEVSGPVDLLHLYIEQGTFDRAVIECLDADPARVDLRDETYVRDPTIEAVMRFGMLPLAWDEPADRLAATHAARMLTAYLATRFTDRRPGAAIARGGLAPAIRRRVVELIEAELDTALTIDDLAAAAGLSAYHFARAFKRTMGSSPHRFVLQRRIDQARLLLQGGLPVAATAQACGFASQSHFSARFKALVGTSPARFAKFQGRAR